MQRLLASICCILMVSIGHADSVASLPADIAPQPLAQALAGFSKQTGVQLGYVAELAATLESKGAHATVSAADALTQLLDGTGLKFEFLNDRTVRIFTAPAQPALVPLNVHAARPANRSESPLTTLGEVIVTATRREEQMNHVPMSIAVWTQEAMEASGVKSMTEIGALTPGVEFDFQSGVGDFFTNIVIRGVTNPHNTMIGIFLDDARIPTIRGDSYMRAFPLTFDLDRVEVLRGPQGTLLGEGTGGGAVRFITNQPSLTTFSALARTELAMTARGDPSYEVGAAAGGPMIPDVLGFRVSGWYRSDGGYVDRVDPLTGVKLDDNSNLSVSETFRGALTWAPTDSVRITPSLTYQSVGLRHPSSFDRYLSRPRDGELRAASYRPSPYDDSYYLAALKLTATFRTTDLITDTSYFDQGGGVTLSSGDTVDPGDDFQAEGKQRVFSQEVRLASADSAAALTWVAGMLYSNERLRLVSHVDALDAREDTVTDRTQLAAFGQIDLKMTKHLTASAGVRIERVKSNSITQGPPVSHAEVAETWLAPRFEMSYEADGEDLYYLSVAKGYASSGTGATYLQSCESPEQFPPETVWSYEIGAKNSLWDGRARLDTSLFHIRWSSDVNPAKYCLRAGGNAAPGGTAASNGFDLAARLLVTEHVKAGLAIAYTDAHYTRSTRLGDAIIIHKGDVPGPHSGQVTSPWSATGSLEYSRVLSNGATVSARAEDIFHSRNPGPFATDNPAWPNYSLNGRTNPSTNVLNVRTAVTWPRFDVALFVNNAFDSEPVVFSQADNDLRSVTAATFRPRTVGVTASWRF